MPGSSIGLEKGKKKQQGKIVNEGGRNAKMGGVLEKKLRGMKRRGHCRNGVLLGGRENAPWLPFPEFNNTKTSNRKNI